VYKRQDDDCVANVAGVPDKKVARGAIAPQVEHQTVGRSFVEPVLDCGPDLVRGRVHSLAAQRLDRSACVFVDGSSDQRDTLACGCAGGTPVFGSHHRWFCPRSMRPEHRRGTVIETIPPG
jgi:hypothetical protein